MTGIVDILILCLIIGFSIVSGFAKEKDQITELTPAQRKKKRIRSLLYMIAGALCLYFLSPGLFQNPDFGKMGRGVVLGRMFTELVVIMSTTHLFMELIPDRLRKRLNLERDEEDEVDTIGFKRPPQNTRELLLLSIFLVVAALFEELVYRQFSFYLVNRVFGWRGDMLVIVSAVFFTLSHKLDLRKGLSIFFGGLVLGKLYQQTGSILVPFIVHFCMNFPIVLIAARRIRRLGREQAHVELTDDNQSINNG